MKDSEQYKALPAKISQQVLKLLAQNWTAFFAALTEYKNDDSRFTGEPKPPILNG
jgi:putative transposase